MGLVEKIKAMATELDSLDTLFKEQLQECYNIENEIIGAMPEMVSAASSPELKSAFEQHLEATRQQKDRLEQIFRDLGQEPKEEKSAGMAGILSEGQVFANARGKPEVKDAALIGVAQHVEHFEMATYGTLRSFAQRLGHPEVASILQQTLDEEKMTDKRLSELAEGGINQRASWQPDVSGRPDVPDVPDRDMPSI